MGGVNISGEQYPRVEDSGKKIFGSEAILFFYLMFMFGQQHCKTDHSRVRLHTVEVNISIRPGFYDSFTLMGPSKAI